MDPSPVQVPPEASPPPHLVLEFSLTEAEYADANMRVIAERNRRNAFLYLSLAVGFALIAWTRSMPPEILVWVLPLTYATNAATLYIATRQRLRQAFRTNQRAQAVARVSMTDGGYRSEGGGIDVFLRWETFSHFEEGPSSFLLYIEPQNALILPQSALTATQRDQVRTLLRHKIGRSSPDASAPGFPVSRLIPAERPVPEGQAPTGRP